MRFVADEVYKLNNGSVASNLRGKLNTESIGIFGHSCGGATAGEACLQDSRFKAFINLDGTPFGDTVDQVINQPFMVMTENAKFTPSGGYAKNQKNYLVVTIRGARHMNFTDLNTVIPNAGKLFGTIGTINANRQIQIMNTYIVSFFDKYLKGINKLFLEKTSSQFSEVTV